MTGQRHKLCKALGASLAPVDHVAPLCGASYPASATIQWGTLPTRMMYVRSLESLSSIHGQ